MALHAKPTEEALERLKQQRRRSTISSVVVAFLTLVLVALALGFFLLPSILKESPTIVTYQAQEVDELVTQERKVQISPDRRPPAPSAALSRVIAADTASPMSVPVPDTEVTSPSVDFGTDDDFGSGWSDGDGSSGGGASFFNQQVKAQRIAYVIDYSQSMSGVRDSLMRAELEKSVGQLRGGMEFQLIFFAGPVWLAGQEVKMDKGRKSAKVIAGAREYDWESGGSATSWDPKGAKQKATWQSVTGKTLEKAVESIKKTPLVYGTIWNHPLDLALSMEPKPDVIFFMTDGVAGKTSPDVAKEMGNRAKRMNVIINTVALMVPQAQDALKDLAKRSGGQFTIVKEGGKVEVVPLD